VGAHKAFINSIIDQRIKQQLLLGGKRTLNEALRETIGLEIIKLVVRSSVTLWKTSETRATS
jgi:hypothetical protein